MADQGSMFGTRDHGAQNQITHDTDKHDNLPRVHQVFLSSFDKSAGTNSRAVYNITGVFGQSDHGWDISLHDAVIPHAVYPINSNNNKVYFKEGGGATLTATLDAKSYTGTQLATEVALQLTAAGATYVGTYDTQTYKLTITKSATDFLYVTGANSAYDVLGFLETGTSFTTSAVAQTSDHPIDVSGTTYIDICIKNLSHSNWDSRLGHDVLARVPVDSGFGSFITYHAPGAHPVNVSQSGPFTTLEVELRDDRGLFWELPANHYAKYTLSLHPRFEGGRQNVQAMRAGYNY